MNLNELKELVKVVFKTQIETGKRQSIHISAAPGTGKSETMEQISQELTVEWKEPVSYLPFFLSTCEPYDVGGMMLPSKDENGNPCTVRTKAPWAPRASAKYGILNLDEVRQAGHDTQKPAAELLNNGSVGITQLPITWLVVGCSNREKDRSGVQRELAFFANRCMNVNADPHLDTWLEWAEKRGDIHPHAMAFARWKPGLVFAGEVPEKPGPFCTPRTLVKTSYLINRLPINLFTEAAAGYLGEGTAAEFVAFLRVAEQLPSFEEICQAPLKAPVPERPDASYAAMQMVAHRVDGKTAPQAFQYLKRMGREFQTAGLKAAFRRCPQMLNTPEFAQWIRDNRELVLSATLVDKGKK